jgi:mRNA interferase RelE/StbE
MSYSIEYESEALADLEKLAPNIRKRIVNKIEWLAQNFEQITPQSLTGDWNANGEYRRLLFESING